PGGLEKVLGIDQSKLTGTVIDLSELLPFSLLIRVKQAEDLEERIRLLEDFFLLAMKKKSTRDHYLYFVNQTIAAYTEGGMKYNVNELSAHLFTSSKTIT